MADSTITFLETVEAATSLKAIDNSDGTYALAVGLVGAAGASLAKAEDSAHASGDPGIQALTVRRDTPGASAGADGDYQAAITDSSGRLYARVPGSDSVLDQQKVEHRYVYKYLDASGSVKVGPGLLHAIKVSADGGAAVVTVHDALDGASGKFDTIRVLSGDTVSVLYDCTFSNLYVVESSGNAEIMVSYR